MRRFLLFLSIYIISINSYPQNNYFKEYYNVHLGYYMAPTVKDSAQFYTTIDPDTIDFGNIKYYYLSGEVYMKEEIQERRVVMRKKFYPNGKKFFVAIEDGSRSGSDRLVVGRSRIYYLLGFVYGLKIYNVWDSNGVRIAKNGTGSYVEYYEDGTLKVKGKIDNGTRIGNWNWFYSNGNPMISGYYVNQYKKASQFINDCSENFRMQSAYDLDGKAVVFNGEGTFRMNYPNSNQIAFITQYKEEKLVDNFTIFWPNGNIKQMYEIKNGLMNGLFQSNFYNGKVQTRGLYHLGYKYGEWTEYEKNGKKYKIHRFKSVN